MGGDTTTRPRRATWDVTTPAESIAMKLERLDAASLRKVVERACLSSKTVQHAIDDALRSIDTPPAPPDDDARFKPLAKHRSTAKDGRPDCVVVVDPLSTGATLAAMAADRGFLIVRVLSQAFPDEIASCLPDGLTLNWHASLEYDAENPSKTVEALRALDAHVLGVLVGCESGVECHDALTSALRGHPSNGPERSLARRDKHPMGECVRNAGLRAVKQELCSNWDAARVFCEALGVNDTETSAWCVLKPCKSAGTDGVYIAKSLEECEKRFSEILGTETVFGESNDNVLVQEFMKGTEYVVDHVSVEGVHKCVAIWRYDKRPCNGAQFVYYCMELYQSEDGVRESKLTEYVRGVLDALGCRHGPSHAEVMWLDSCDEPCLVEVGCRPHGGEGTFVELSAPTIGYDQLSVMLDLVERPYRVHRLPARPAHFNGGAVEVMLIAHASGIVRSIHLEKIRALKSYVGEEIKIKVGDDVTPTVDFLTTPGSVMLRSQDARQLRADIDAIHALCLDGLFELQQNARIRFKSL